MTEGVEVVIRTTKKDMELKSTDQVSVLSVEPTCGCKKGENK